MVAHTLMQMNLHLQKKDHTPLVVLGKASMLDTLEVQVNGSSSDSGGHRMLVPPPRADTVGWVFVAVARMRCCPCKSKCPSSERDPKRVE